MDSEDPNRIARRAVFLPLSLALRDSKHFFANYAISFRRLHVVQGDGVPIQIVRQQCRDGFGGLGAVGAPANSRVFLPTTSGQMAFSVRLLVISKWPSSRKVISVGDWIKA